MLAKFRKLVFKDDEMNRLQQEVSQVFDSVTGIKYLDGTLVENVFLNATTSIVPHGLEREYQGFIVTSLNGPGIVYIDTAAPNTGKGQQSDKSRFIALKSSASVTCNLWVF